MAKASAGILLYRNRDHIREVFLVHPGGPYWARKDTHAWSMPKGEIEPGEDPVDAARREFFEETGYLVSVPLSPLPPFRASNKVIHAFTARYDIDPATIRSRHFEMEWPPGSKTVRSFPEADRAEWFPVDIACKKLHKGQVKLIDLLHAFLSDQNPGE